jgi:hypothetical protein
MDKPGKSPLVNMITAISAATDDKPEGAGTEV